MLESRAVPVAEPTAPDAALLGELGILESAPELDEVTAHAAMEPAEAEPGVPCVMNWHVFYNWLTLICS